MPDRYHVDIDATYLRFNPDAQHFYRDLCEDIPAFKEYDEGHTIQIKTRIFAWIVCMYDLNTPLRREIKDLYKRKVYAGTLTGLTPHKVTGKYMEFVEKIFTGVDKNVNDLIVKYIASFSSPEYKQLVGHLRIQDLVLGKIISGTVKKDDQVMFDLATEKVKSLTSLLYGSGEREEVYEARRALYKQVSYDLSDMRPENVSRMIVDEGLPDEWSPFEKGYKPDGINFVGDDDTIAEEDER
jgi:hypothetical protein